MHGVGATGGVGETVAAHREREAIRTAIEKGRNESLLQTVMYLAILIIAIVGIQCPDAISMEAVVGSTIALLAIPTLLNLKSIDDSRKLKDRSVCCEETAAAVFIFMLAAGLIVINAIALTDGTALSALCVINGSIALIMLLSYGPRFCELS